MGIILGEHVRRIVAENKGIARKMTIANNIRITDIRRQTLRLAEEKQEGLSFDFIFASSYGDTGSKIEVEGTIFYGGDKKELDEIEKEWKEKKTIPQKLALPINNRALEIGFLQAIALSNQVKLPAPINLPKFITKEAKPAKNS